jgi:hypothetical protein
MFYEAACENRQDFGTFDAIGKNRAALAARIDR